MLAGSCREIEPRIGSVYSPNIYRILVDSMSPKSGPDFDNEGYATVAERIRLFYERHPQGRIETRLVSRTKHEVVFKARVFRNDTDARPAATGWAAEREGDGEVNLVACLENTETSAVGRALANLGFTASRLRPSAEEMAKAARARARTKGGTVVPLRQGERAGHSPPDRMPISEGAADVLVLLAEAVRAGLDHERAQHLATRLRRGLVSDASLRRLERLLHRQLVLAPFQDRRGSL